MRPVKFYIDTHKGVTGPVMLLMLALYQQGENPTAWLYVALHGAYGALWVLKGQLFPDRQWERPVSALYGIGAVWGGLSLYWVGGWLVMAQAVRAPGWWLAGCVSLYTLGIFCHFGADMQKFTALRLAPGRLITDGFWRLSRNPNYFGELCIYAGFGLLAMHWAPIVILMVWVFAVWLPLIRRKEQSLARYPEFSAYQRRVRCLIPFVV